MKVGAFTLHERIGRGAMGDVWRASHRRDGAEAALKVIAPKYACRDEYRRRFRREIRAAAALNHPGIVEIYDYGVVDSNAAADSGLELRAESPYLAMELADGGSLEEAESDLDWPSFRELVIGLLEAVGHAHSRGVVHRDLKPTNVLFAESVRGTRHFKISDFGLAFDERRGRGEGEISDQTAGTPHYMAPEQLRGRWRDYGPWTDLYGLGCLAWRMATGDSPYPGKALMEVAHQHLTRPLPAFEPQFPVPDGFENWLARMLERHPCDRYRTAADALWGLLDFPERLEEPKDASGAAALAPAGRPRIAERLDRAGDRDDRPELPAPKPADSYAPASAGPPERSIRPVVRERPPLPSSWSQRRPPPTSRSRVSAGLNLYGVREFPTVGRDRERDALWEGLREVVDEGSARLLLLRGDAGVGKSRLARWLRECAEEFGAANGLLAAHSAREAVGDGLAGMLESHLDLTGLGASEVRDRLEIWYRARGVDRSYEWRAMAEFAGTAESRFEFSNAHESRALIRRFLNLAAEERPLIVQLDDLQWGLETLHFLRSFFETPDAERIPVLFVGTLREDALAERPLESRVVAELGERDAERTIDVGPMSEADQRVLVEELLHLAPDAARRVVHRADGNPLFAVELVRDWIERGLLEPGERGFELPTEVDGEIPRNLYEIWTGRLRDLTTDRPEESCVALQLGAALGTEVDEDQWRAACEAADLSFPASLVEQLLRHGLLRRIDTGWAFAHSMLRETLVRRAREADRWTRLNRVCAEVFEREDASGPRAERLAGFLLEAGEEERALEPLLRAAEHYDLRMQHQESHRLFERAAACAEDVDLREIGLDADFHLRKGRIAYNVDRDLEAADRAFRRVQRRAEERGDDRLLARALTERSSVAHQQIDYERAVELARQARDLVDDRESLVAVRARFHLADSLRRCGEVPAARESFREAVDSSRDRFPAEHLKSLIQWASCLKNTGELETADEKAREALDRSERLSSPPTRARVFNLLGDIARLRDRDTEARDWYGRGEELAAVIDEPQLFPIFLGRVQIELDAGAHADALEALAGLRRHTEGRRQIWFAVALLAFELHAAAGADEWETVASDLERLETIFDEDVPSIHDAAESIGTAARMAADAGRDELARRAGAVAHSIWTNLDDERAEQLREWLGERGLATPV